MTKFPWVGRTQGDHRVVCLNTMKVYSCPGSAAMDLNVKIFEVEACANILMRDVGGNKFAWFAQYRVEHGINSLLPREIEYHEVIKPDSQYERLRRLHQSLKQYNARVRYMTNNMLALINDDIYHGEELTMRELIAMLESRNVAVGLIPRHLCQHFFAHKKSYERIIVMKFSKKFSKPDHREVTAVSWSKPQYPEQVYRWEDDESFHMKSHGSHRPVIDLNSRRIFASIRAAYRITGIKPDIIRWNCFGDLDQVSQKSGGYYNFKFVRFVKNEG
jgi:hypothetical protein